MKAFRINRWLLFSFITLLFVNTGCNNRSNKSKNQSTLFPPELVDFLPYENNPVFTGTGTATWDSKIRERGYILREDSVYKMWYTGYHGNENMPKYLGYATSKDGIHWSLYPENPIFNKYETFIFFITHPIGTAFTAV